MKAKWLIIRDVEKEHLCNRISDGILENLKMIIRMGKGCRYFTIKMLIKGTS